MQSPRRPRRRNRLIGLALAVGLLVAMFLNTKFLTPTQLATALPKPFDAQSTAAELFHKAQGDLPKRARPLGTVVPAIQADPKAAAAKFSAVSPADNAYVFAVSATGKVTEASAVSLRLSVPGVPAQTPVLVPLGTAVNGTVLRDAMGFKFADAPGQTDFQHVGDELKKLAQAQIGSSVANPPSLKGKQVRVLGVINVLVLGGAPPKAKPVSVQPVTIKVAP